jgi:hypothetical protein
MQHIMLLLIHISLALLSLVSATVALAVPSLRKIRLNYALAAGTLVSGTYLVMSAHAPLVSACSSGLVYVGFVAAMTMAAYRRLHQPE